MGRGSWVVGRGSWVQVVNVGRGCGYTSWEVFKKCLKINNEFVTNNEQVI